jgi:hypothetical protein
MALVINSTTGVIDVSASTAGTYVVSYTVGQDVATTTVVINSTPTSTITGATSYCAGTGGTTLIANGSQVGDTISWYKNGVATGQSTATITGQLAGTYSVKISRPTSGEGACLDESSDHVVTELPSQNTNFNYQNSSYAQDGTDPTPVATTSGGTFTASPSGLSINSSTGKIDLSASSVNTYTITYSLPAPCPSTTSRTVGITPAAYSSVYSVGFDGVNDYLQENYYNLLSGQSSFTISAWVYFTGPSTMYPVFNLWQSTNRVLLMRYWNGQWQFYRRTTLDTTRSLFYTASIEQNRWYHFVCVNDVNTMRIYLDSVNVATSTNEPGGTRSANVGGRVGWYTSSVENYGNFLVDEITQYTSALSSSNVTSLYNNGVPTNPVGSPVNWWKMGEDSAGNGSTIANDGSGVNYLTRTNGASFYTEPAGIFNQRSIDFDGTNDFVTFGDNNAWSFVGAESDSPLSISAWIKADSTTGGILAKYGRTGYEWFFYINSGQIRFLIRNSSSGTPHKLVYTSATISTNTWTHVAVTYDGQYFNSNFGMKIYKDGSEITNLTTSSSGNYFGMINYSTPMTMGSASGGTYFNGRIDECALFNYVISPNAVSEIYNSGSPQKDLNNLTNAITDPIMWARGGDRDTFSTLSNRGSLNINGTYTNMAIDDINFDVKT